MTRGGGAAGVRGRGGAGGGRGRGGGRGGKREYPGSGSGTPNMDSKAGASTSKKARGKCYQVRQDF